MKNRDKLMIFTFASLALSLVSTITYMIYTIINNGSFMNHIISTIGVIILVVIAVFLVITGFFIENKKAKIFIIIAALLLSIYSITQIIVGITKPSELLPDFTNYDIKDVVNWAKERNIILEKEYEYSDEIETYHIIKHNPSKGTNIKNIKKLTVTISNGIDPNKTTVIDNMVGWKLDDVIKVIDDNQLTNVTIDFEFSNTVEKDTIISQDVISEVTRNEPIKLVSSLGRESDQKSVVVEKIVGLDLFHALIYLGRNNIKYSIIYTYDEDKENIVLKQSIKPYEVINHNKKQEMVITVTKKDKVTIPNLNEMTISEIDYWALNNKIIIDYKEVYDDTVKENKIISFNNKVGNLIKPDSRIEIIISKGVLKMIEFTSVADFEEWAKEANIAYNIEYEYSPTVEQGKVIRSSHNKNDIIKNTDMVNITISQGSKTIIPSLVNKLVDEAKELCKQSNIKCTFEYLENDYTIITKQSMKANSSVPSGTTINLIVGK